LYIQGRNSNQERELISIKNSLLQNHPEGGSLVPLIRGIQGVVLLIKKEILFLTILYLQQKQEILEKICQNLKKGYGITSSEIVKQ